MQPITGLHIASLIDRQTFDVRLYHEDWHGPFDAERREKYDLVFLTGLQPDFDRMRQLQRRRRHCVRLLVGVGAAAE